SSRRRHTRFSRDWSSDVCSSDLGGVNGMYAHLRYIYGQAYYYNTTLTGTDEATYAQSADGNFKDMDLSGVGSITPSSSRSDVIRSEERRVGKECRYKWSAKH